VRFSKLKKATTCAPTAPTINPIQPFVLVGEGQRFSQGGRLALFRDRRLSGSLGSNMQGAVAALKRTGDRPLQSIDTPEG
jgi:Na+-transporting NADH:ubiquinone oxidoreductase subunit NqrA